MTATAHEKRPDTDTPELSENLQGGGVVEGGSGVVEDARRHQRRRFLSKHHDVLPDVAALTMGIHILTSLILAFAVLNSLGKPLEDAIITLLLVASFTFVYYYGSDWKDHWTKSMQLTWVMALTVLWLAMLPTVALGVYLVFPLFFLYLRVIPGWAGMMCVIAATFVAIVSQIPVGLTVGGIIGPIMSALITLVINYAVTALWKANREHQELIRELMDTQEELAQSQHEAGVAAERQRLAHEIHDTLAQGLSSIQMLLNVAESEIQSQSGDPLSRIRLARETAADNLSEARAMIASLQPAALSQASLSDALARIAQTATAQSGIEVAVDVDGLATTLPMKKEAMILRIVQGAVGNVVKHSQASRARITVTYNPHDVRVDIVDNGQGFDPESVKNKPKGLGHIGLTAMRERAAEVNATFDAESSPGGGTAISVVIPRS